MSKVVSPDAAVQLVYLVAGVERMVDAARKADSRFDHPATASGGHLGMVGDLMPYAEIVGGYIEKMAGHQDWPGVFEYEVTEELGCWLADHWTDYIGHRPDLFTAELHKQGDLFFNQASES